MLRDGSFEGSQDGGNNVQGDADRCERVHRKLKRIVGARGKLDAEEAAALREALKLRIWRTYDPSIRVGVGVRRRRRRR